MLLVASLSGLEKPWKTVMEHLKAFVTLQKTRLEKADPQGPKI